MKKTIFILALIGLFVFVGAFAPTNAVVVEAAVQAGPPKCVGVSIEMRETQTIVQVGGQAIFRGGVLGGGQYSNESSTIAIQDNTGNVLYMNGTYPYGYDFELGYNAPSWLSNSFVTIVYAYMAVDEYGEICMNTSGVMHLYISSLPVCSMEGLEFNLDVPSFVAVGEDLGGSLTLEADIEPLNEISEVAISVWSGMWISAGASASTFPPGSVLTETFQLEAPAGPEITFFPTFSMTENSTECFFVGEKKTVQVGYRQFMPLIVR